MPKFVVVTMTFDGTDGQNQQPELPITLMKFHITVIVISQQELVTVVCGQCTKQNCKRLSSVPSTLSACPQTKPVLPLSFPRHAMSNLSLKISHEVQISGYFRASFIFPIRKVFFMKSNLHVPCYTLTLLLCTPDIKNKLFSSSSCI